MAVEAWEDEETAADYAKGDYSVGPEGRLRFLVAVVDVVEEEDAEDEAEKGGENCFLKSKWVC